MKSGRLLFRDLVGKAVMILATFSVVYWGCIFLGENENEVWNFYKISWNALELHMSFINNLAGQAIKVVYGMNLFQKKTHK